MLAHPTAVRRMAGNAGLPPPAQHSACYQKDSKDLQKRIQERKKGNLEAFALRLEKLKARYFRDRCPRYSPAPAAPRSTMPGYLLALQPESDDLGRHAIKLVLPSRGHQRRAREGF